MSDDDVRHAAIDFAIASLWAGGRNTAEIANALMIREAVVANALPYILEQRRQGRLANVATG